MYLVSLIDTPLLYICCFVGGLNGVERLSNAWKNVVILPGMQLGERRIGTLHGFSSVSQFLAPFALSSLCIVINLLQPPGDLDSMVKVDSVSCTMAGLA